MAKTPRWPARAVLIPLVALLYPLLAPGSLGATPPPTKEQWEQYRQDGSLKARIAQALALGKHRVRPDLAASARYRLEQAAVKQGLVAPEKARMLMAPPPGRVGMPTKGTVKVLVLCIDFSDQPHSATNTMDYMRSRLFGDGGGAAAPNDSLHNFYLRSSYGQLDIQGTVLGWYRPSYTRASMPDTTGTDRQQAVTREKLIREALEYYNGGAGGDIDFTQFDNNRDGKIDYFAIVWSGPDTGWSEFWWGYQTGWWATESPVLDGMRVGDYSWQWESRPAGGAFEPSTIIHETGHAMGLPDYYDYKSKADGDTVGPDGGVGGLDQMDSRGDHNCFSKWLLDWIEPRLCRGVTANVELRASDGERDAAILLPLVDRADPFSEFFMVQNRQRTGNDRTIPGSGLLVWHVDGTLNASGTDFQFNNSDTAHKLLRLMEADGLEEIEQDRNANAGDFYVGGSSFGPSTSPNSSLYSGQPTGLGIDAISPSAATMSFNVTASYPDATPPVGAPTAPTDEGATTAKQDLVFQWGAGTVADPDSGLIGYRLQVGTRPDARDVFDGFLGNVLGHTLPGMGQDGHTYYARVAAVNGSWLPSAWSPSSDGITVAFPVFDGAALDAPNLAFRTNGALPWTVQTATSHLGGSAGQSGAVGHSQASYVQTTVTGPCSGSFWWKVSSEAGYDTLAFTLDGQHQTPPISGEVDWTKVDFQVPAGTHVLRWTYAKDGGATGGQDRAYLDHVVLDAAPQAPAITSFSPASAYAGATVTIAGSGFTGATKVTFNGLDAPSFSVTGATQVTAVVPAGSASGPIAVTTPGGTATSSAAFTSLGVPPAPVVTTFSPAAACVGTTVTVEGSGLDTTTSVTFGGISATFTVQSATRLSAVVPAGAASGTLRVVTAGGSAEAPAAFTLRGFDLNAVSGVDLADLARIARSFGKRSGDAGFDAACDLNGDGVVDEKDATLLFAHLD